MEGKGEKCLQKKLKWGINKQKYDLFYDVSHPVAWWAEGAPSAMGVPELRHKLLVTLRVHTLARSSDLVEGAPTLWEHQGRLYLRFLAKSFCSRLLVIFRRKPTLFHLKYVCTTPSLFQIRHLTNLDKALGSGDLSQMVLQDRYPHVQGAILVGGGRGTAFMVCRMPQALIYRRSGCPPPNRSSNIIVGHTIGWTGRGC